MKKLYHNAIIRYVFFGGCTTMVNLISFYLLRKAGVELHIANAISIVLAILFAYVVNSRFVFQDKAETLAEHVQPFLKFIGARALTMVIEMGGVFLLVGVMHLNDMVGKLITQVIVLILNYVFSKFFVFTTKK
ncbi:MAG: GtrA family protein [Blautia sp.]|nr:GtrA family protein [Blautia sp.]